MILTMSRSGEYYLINEKGVVSYTILRRTYEVPRPWKYQTGWCLFRGMPPKKGIKIEQAEYVFKSLTKTLAYLKEKNVIFTNYPGPFHCLEGLGVWDH